MQRTGIILLNWNAAKETTGCVRDMQTFLPPEATMYVVDNKSNSADRARLRLEQDCRDVVFIWNDKNLGYAGGNNVGIRRAVSEGCDFILLLNNDARIQEKDFFLLEQSMQAEAQLGVVGPLIRDRPGGAILNAGGRDIGRYYLSHFKQPAQPDSLYDVAYVSGTVCLIRAVLFAQIGLLDEDYFFSGELADFCARAQQHSTCWRTAVQPAAEAVHDLSVSQDNRGGIYTYYTVRNRFLYIRKHLPASAPWLFSYWTALHLRHAFRCLREKKQTEMRMVLQGLADGLRGKFGPFGDKNA
jgi:hypothetical protein